MRFAIIVAMLLVGPAEAQRSNFVQSNFSFQPRPEAPAALQWQLCTVDDSCVTFKAPDANYSGTIQHQVTPLNAADFGVDFGAWSQAVVDPAYNRSIMTFGTTTKEQPFVNVTPFHLERLSIWVFDYTRFQMSPISVGGGVLDYISHIPGDFNYDGWVDALDYLRWRNGTEWVYHATRPDGKPVPEDYDLWRAYYGRNDWETLPSSSSGLSAAAIPEPATLVLIAFLALLALAGRCRRD